MSAAVVLDAQFSYLVAQIGQWSDNVAKFCVSEE